MLDVFARGTSIGIFIRATGSGIRPRRNMRLSSSMQISRLVSQVAHTTVGIGSDMTSNNDRVERRRTAARQAPYSWRVRMLGVIPDLMPHVLLATVHPKFEADGSSGILFMARPLQ
jgi:hypothetical protein